MLPPALVDLTLARLSVPYNLAGPVRFQNGRVRHMQHAALALKPLEQAPLPPSTSRPRNGSTLKKRSNAGGSLKVRATKAAPKFVSKLAQKVQQLEEVATEQEAAFDPPTFSEEQLTLFYEDVLSHSYAEDEAVDQTQSTPDPEVQFQEDLKVVDAAHERLGITTNGNEIQDDSPLLKTLRQYARSNAATSASTDIEQEDGSFVPPYRRVIRRLQRILGELERARLAASSSAELASNAVTINLLSLDEWNALYRVCLHLRDGEAGEDLLDSMKRSQQDVHEDYLNGILELYVEDSDVALFESCLARFVQGPPTEQQRHLHVKTHLKATTPKTIPTTALSTLHSYELQSSPPAMKTYTSLITHLFSLPNPTAQAQAWDLFSHMRYVAHPNPDTFLYTLMIRACASSFNPSRSSDPERALDLWTEMTVDRRLTPHSGTFNAIILACARSGRKLYVNEAFRLAKEMLDSHRDAHGRSAYSPDRKTFCALLEGAKRVGDLARARWILAEMVTGRNVDVEIDEEVMMHVFHAYAAYRPPFKRSMALLVDEQKVDDAVVGNANADAVGSEPAESGSENTRREIAESSSPTFTHIPPQDHHEVVVEAETLFHRILDEKRILSESLSSHHLDDTFQGSTKFANVNVTSRLLNSYLSVLYKHGSLDSCRKLFWEVFEDAGVERNARSYMEAFERCASSKKAERGTALAFAEELYEKWKVLEDGDAVIPSRTIEKVHIAFIKILTITENLDRAMDHLHWFAERYPPSAIRDRQTITKPAMRATRTALQGDRPLVRLTSVTEVPDDKVPPLMIWNDLEVLHHRLVIRRREKDIGYIKYICKAYEWALRVRRDEAMRAKPVEQ